ncbi:MAG: nucleotidyltransferase domain-containing protein [bacterium]|nr:nucleotidyltransferase domain-containing protein [bacterium]
MGFDISLWEKIREEEVALREKERKRTLIKTKNLLRRYFVGKKAKKVFLLGSIIKKGNFYPFSDIDIAVDEVGERYFKTLSELEDLLGRNVDLIELQKSRLKGFIEKEGLRIR